MDVLASRGIEHVLLKGQAIEAVLFDPGERVFSDVDVLVDPARFEDASDVLSAAGYVNRHAGARLSETSTHAREFVGLGVFIDLHHHVRGVDLLPHDAWRVWRGCTTSLRVANRSVSVLDRAGVLVMVCLEAGRRGRVTDDLRRAVDRVSDEAWSEAWELAVQLRCEHAIVAALGLLAGGAAILERHGFSARDPRRGALLGFEDVPIVAGLMRFTSTRGWTARARLLAEELVPSPAGLRYWRPAAGRSRLTMALYYAYRPVYLIVHTPLAAFTYWSTARRQGNWRPSGANGKRGGVP